MDAKAQAQKWTGMSCVILGLVLFGACATNQKVRYMPVSQAEITKSSAVCYGLTSSIVRTLSSISFGDKGFEMKLKPFSRTPLSRMMSPV